MANDFEDLSRLTRVGGTCAMSDMQNFKTPIVLLVLAAVWLPLLNSCGLPAATGRSLNRMLYSSSTGDESVRARTAMFESLGEIHREEETAAVNPPAAGSTR